MTSPQRPRALLLTVGTGDVNRTEESLLTPLRKSIDQGEWSRIVLLPSMVTEQSAAELKARCGRYPIEISPLSAPDMENDADRCFDDFDHVIGRLREAGYAPADIIVDFTRGTKAMSAALVLAAIRHDLRALRYITGERDDRGMVKAGTERIFETSPAIATAQKTLDVARSFALQGNFAGALALLPDDCGVAAAWPVAVGQDARALRPALDFYSAWDRLDYKSATKVELGEAAPLVDWQPVWPTPAMREWVAGLALPTPREEYPAMAARLGLLAADLLANGERRIRDRHFEDAVLRAYRVLELVGQRRLFDHGLDSERLPPDNAAVQTLKKKLERKGSASFGKNSNGTLTAGRLLVARLLKVIGDPLAQKLLDFNQQPNLNCVANRNISVLIHGFEAVGPNEDVPLRALYGELEQLLLEDTGVAARRCLDIARTVDFSAHSISSPDLLATPITLSESAESGRPPSH